MLYSFHSWFSKMDQKTRRRVGEDVSVPLVSADSQAMGDGVRRQTVPSSLEGDRANIALLLFLYTLQGVPLGLAAAVPMILQNKGVLYKDQVIKLREVSVKYPAGSPLGMGRVMSVYYIKKKTVLSKNMLSNCFIFHLLLLFLCNIIYKALGSYPHTV